MSPTTPFKSSLTASKGSLKNLKSYWAEVTQFNRDNSTPSIKEFFEYLRDDLEVELHFEIEDLMAEVERVTPDSDGTEKEFSNKEKVEDYKWREDVLLRVMAAHSIDESQRDAFLHFAVNFNPNVKRSLKKADLESAAEQFTANAMGYVEAPTPHSVPLSENISKVPRSVSDMSWFNKQGADLEESILDFNMRIITEFGTKYPEYRALQQTPYPFSADLPFSFTNSKLNYSASLDGGIAQAITSLDSVKSHPHSADFDFHEYAWCLKTLGDIRNNECSISDYACELILGYAEHLQNKVLVDPIEIDDAKEYNPEVGEDDTILLDDYIRTAAQEISKLDKHIDYDQFDDPCGPAALIRVDTVLDDGLTMELGYRCMNCQMIYDEGYRKYK